MQPLYGLTLYRKGMSGELFSETMLYELSVMYSILRFWKSR